MCIKNIAGKVSMVPFILVNRSEAISAGIRVVIRPPERTVQVLCSVSKRLSVEVDAFCCSFYSQ
jgi:hypothetical protein